MTSAGLVAHTQGDHTVLTAHQRSLLTQAETALVDSTSPQRLRNLSLDEVGSLYDRVRKERDKYRTLHRRQASAQVTKDHSRGTAAAKNQGTSAKYEIFEEALARVSRREAALAQDSAEELRAQRLEAARAAKRGGSSAPRPTTSRNKPQSSGRGPIVRTKGPSGKVTSSVARSKQARGQAKRDGR